MTEETQPSLQDINPTWNKPNGGAKVAVIGCGPGGMFVCHAVESQRQKLLAKLKLATTEDQRASLQLNLDQLPSVMCFEQASAPGGVWRSTKKTGNKTDTSMYEALWCNGPKEVMEFADYTFEEHFGAESKLPLYLPRQAVLDYLMTRVTRHCPEFFDKYAQLETRVNTVTYNATTQQFTVQTTHLPTQTTTTALYDKVIWSAGQNGKGKIPGPILHPFQEARTGYLEQQQQISEDSNNSDEKVKDIVLPPFLHASSMEQVANQIKGRHLLLIGGSYSAEDLAFMGIKWGAKHITVLTRRHGIDVPVCWTTNWPDNKVTVEAGYVVKKVNIVAGTNGPSYNVSLSRYGHETDLIEIDETIVPKKNDGPPSSPTTSNVETRAATSSPTSVTDTTKTIDSVDVVICCTGYTEHLEMLDKSCYNMSDEEYDTYWKGKDILELPEGWTMPENPMTGIMKNYYAEDDEEKKLDDDASPEAIKDDIPPSGGLYPGCYVNPYSYREFIFVRNPNLMWLAANNFDAPLLALDVQANLAVKFLTGQKQMPTLQKMKAENYEQALMEMAMPMVRYWMDDNYYKAVQKWLAEQTRMIHYNSQGNRCSRYEYPLEWEAAYQQTSKWELHLMARLMQEGDYPLQLGTLHELNENGKEFMRINWGSRNYATCAKTGTTFRDVDAKQCATIQSVLTGAIPSPLKGRWLDIDDFAENVSDMVASSVQK